MPSSFSAFWLLLWAPASGGCVSRLVTEDAAYLDCSRIADEAARDWKRVDELSSGHVWSPGKKDAIRRALKTDARELKTTTRVFVYPMPGALRTPEYFVDAFPNVFFQRKDEIIFRQGGSTTLPSEETFNEGRWTPSEKFQMVENQHLLGVRIHGELKRQGLTVEDPDEADLFFVPAYHLHTNKSSNFDFCNRVIPLWMEHLETFRIGRTAMSYLRRYKGRDHFVVSGRGVHRVKPERVTSKFSAWRHFLDCPQFATEPQLQNMQVLLPEAQCPYARGHGRLRPVPYPSRSLGQLLTKFGYQHDVTLGSYLFAVKRPRPIRAALAVKAGALGGPLKAKTRLPFRSILQAQCQASNDCNDVPFTSLEMNPNRMADARFAYANATFCIQPPGYSAARKGIVDSLVLGCIPVLFRNDSLLQNHHPMSLDHLAPKNLRRRAIVFDPLDQSDLWPWHWPFQSASAVTLQISDVEKIGLLNLLADIPDDQIVLARKVIAHYLPYFLWDHQVDTLNPLALRVALRHLAHLVPVDCCAPPSIL